MTQRKIEITSPTFIDAWKLPTQQNLALLFPTQQPLALEIGCGIGDFIIQRAAQQPHINFIAIDIYNKGCYKTCRRIDTSALTNVRVMRMEARYLLSQFGHADMLSAIYINCPDPWPKKRHRSRRLVSHTFLTQMLYYLKPQGDLYFVTDVENYAQQVAETLSTLDGYTNQLDCCYTNQLNDYPQSKYMRRFAKQGLPVYFQHHRRDAQFTLHAHMLPATTMGFRNRHTLEVK
ncbi:MAG: tRNA (guanosine(46)-N7)-methyltransferase TrmB [Desulfobacteraceae bacterium 4572_35.1]|nr:MAG: tRNA (guanosine(46)-N7)-methyltransferase TrmB [Desulfobacteraceae bacterium 4572_35.1]